MRSRTTRKLTYHFVFWSSVAAVAAIGAYSIFTEKLLPTWSRWHLSRLVMFCENTAPVVVPLLGVAVIVLNVWLRRLETPAVVNAVHGLLSEIQKVVFSHLEQLPEHERRVTLFKHVSWHWTVRGMPWGGWLVAYERSGDTTRKRVSAFRASLSRPAEAEGVAGQAFANGGVEATGLLAEISLESPADVLAEYARRTYVPPEWVVKWMKAHPRQKPPRSMCAIPIMAGGKRWGVLVLDACGEIKYNKTVKKQQYPLFTGLLGQLLGQ